MMDHFEQVEKLREKANVTYDEAKEALEKCHWDLLDAMVYLERQGKVKGPQTENYTTQKVSSNDEANTQQTDAPKNTATFGDICNRFLRWCGQIIQKGNINFLEAHKDGRLVLSLPVTAVVLLLLLIFPVCLVLIVIGLFCGYHFSFRGPHLGRKDVNNTMEKASATVDQLKQEIQQKQEASRQNQPNDLH